MASAKLMHQATLKAKGWTKTTVSVFGMPEDHWISPVNGRTYRLAAALKSQERLDNRRKKKK